MKRVAVLGLSIATLTAAAVTGCGTTSSKSSGPPESPVASASSRSSAPAPTTAETTSAAPAPTAPAAGGEVLHFTLTTADGWHYKGSYDFTRPSLIFSKDISSSPPGEAEISQRAASAQSNYPTSGKAYENVDAGRSGPPLTLWPPSLIYPVTISLAPATGGSPPGTTIFTGSAPSCVDATDPGLGVNPYPFEDQVVCNWIDIPTDPVPVTRGNAYYTAESIVDVGLGELNGTTPWLVAAFQIGNNSGACNVFISPTGSVKIPQGQCDATISGTVTR